MSDDENLLEIQLEEVQRLFANHPYITIVSTEGTPVNKYIVEYRVKGLVRLDDGEIAKSDQHRVEISLSFGFPHFPPNCKPLTQIFHPDIDPSAIKIADFWTVEGTLASLITYIGQMICWQVYSEENVFNQDAADWLAKNSDSVPLDSIDLSGVEAGDAGAEPAKAEGAAAQGELNVDLGLSAEDLPELAFDSVDLGKAESPPPSDQSEDLVAELDFAIKDSAAPAPASPPDEVPDLAKDLDFGFKAPETPDDRVDAPAEIVVEEIDIDIETPVDEVEGEVDLDFATVDIDHDILRGMMDQRNFFAAQRKMTSMKPENLSQASAALRPEIESQIRNAERIFQEATELEGQGLLEEAARKFEAVLNVARDYPDLEMNMKRVRNAWMAASAGESAEVEAPDVSEFQEVDLGAGLDETGPGELSLSLESEDSQDLAAGAAAPAFPQPDVSDSLSLEQRMPPPSSEPDGSWSPPGAEVKAKKKTTPAKVTVQEEKSKKPLLVAGCVVLLILALSAWIFMEWTSFNKAQEKWSTVHALLEKGDYEQVSKQCAEITELLSRVHIVMAPKKKKLLSQVQDIVGSEHFQEAMGGKIYYKNQYISAMAHKAYLEIESLVAEGEKKGAISEWQGALASYEAALDVAEKNKQRLDEVFYTKVVFKVKQAQFANHVAQGKKAFISKSWTTAIDHFSKAMELAQLKDVADPTSSHDVNRYLQRARFSQFLVDGDASLKEGNWKEAVTNYQGAYDIATKEEVIDRASRESVTLKLHQTTLMKGLTEGDQFTQAKKWGKAVAEYEKAESVLPYDVTIPGKSVAETQNIVAGSLLTALYNRDQEEARAYFSRKEYDKAASVLKRSIRAIDSSPLKSKAHWQLMKKQAEEDLQKASLQGVIEEKTAYLKEHYKDVFIENFVGVRALALDQPQVKFLEATGSALVFRLRCRELRDLKHYTLELIYQYDMAKDKWGFQGGD